MINMSKYEMEAIVNYNESVEAGVLRLYIIKKNDIIKLV